MAIFTDGNSDSHNDSWTTTDIKSNGKNEPTRIIFFISSLVENLNLKLEMFVVSLSGVVCAGGGPEIKFQMIVETDVGVLCRRETETVYVMLVRQLYQPESLLTTKVTSVTGPGIFLSGIFYVITHPHLIQTIRLAELPGSFSVQ